MMNAGISSIVNTGRPSAGAVCAPRRRCFTLIEMMVSLAVLALALSVVGVVFTATTTAASQAAAYSEAHAWASQWMREIKKDLDGCNPAESVLIMVGRTQAASLTQSDLEARKYYRVLTGDPSAVAPNYDPAFDPNLDPQYSNPRADILAFFTNRPVVSQAPPTGQSFVVDPYLKNGGKQDLAFVVYGHAALDQPVWDGSRYVFPAPNSPTLQHIGQDADGGTSPGRPSRIPATRWHLARRATVIINDATQAKWTFNSDDWRRIQLCEAYRQLPGDGAVLNWAQFLADFGPNFAAGRFPSWLVPYNADTWSGGLGYLRDRVYGLLYGTTAGFAPLYHVATVLEEVPVELRSNLALHMLPGCAWFQVEFLMPEDPRNSVVYSADPSNYPSVPNPSHRWDMPRWTSLPPSKDDGRQGVTYVFVPDSAENRQSIVSDAFVDGIFDGNDRLSAFGRLDQDGSKQFQVSDAVAQRIVRTWPYAIRITVRVFDRQGRLKEPIVRSVVHRFE